MNCSFVHNNGRGGRRIIRKTLELLCGCFLGMLMAFPVNAVPADPPAETASNASLKTSGTFETSSSCSICHQNIYEQFADSMHARSFTNPLFLKTYFDVLVKRSAGNDALAEEMNGCIACHSPMTFIRTGGGVVAPKQVGSDHSGVECDLCHRITGFKGPDPGGGNYLAKPGTQKFGPFPKETDWHHVYAELQTKSELCAICHNRVNRFGVEIISTYSEWKESRYAKENIQCQDCHMNSNGFLTAGKPVFESGRASQNSLTHSPDRRRLYTHRFPGAHSESQVKGAIKLYIQVESAALAPGKEAVITVLVDNSKSGHKLPTGTAELRLVYLELYAEAGDRIIPLPASSSHPEMLDVSGRSTYDREILGEGFPQGRRLYRAVCVDSAGQQTLYSFDTEKIVFDNRLAADEVRKEFFTFSVPEGSGPKLSLIAKLYYLRYPEPFAEKLGIAKTISIELATVRKNIVLGEPTD